MITQPSSCRSKEVDSARLAEMIANEFYGSLLDLSSRGKGSRQPWSQLPEVKCVQKIRRNARVSDRDVRLFLTFICAMDRARNAERLWRAGIELFEMSPQTFDPVEVSGMSLSKLCARLYDSGVSQRHGPDSEAWLRIAESLVTGSGSVCRAIDQGVGDAKELLRDLGSRDPARRPRFPMLRGPKIGPMWIRIMANPGGAEISCMEIIPVAVDRQVRRVTENLRVTDTQGLELHWARCEIQFAWHKAVSTARVEGPSGIKGTCAALDPALWFYGRHGCSHCERKRKRVPIGSACKYCQLGKTATEET